MACHSVAVSGGTMPEEPGVVVEVEWDGEGEVDLEVEVEVGVEVEKLIQQHKELQKRHEDLVFYATTAPQIDDLEEHILQLDVKLEEQTAEVIKLHTENNTYWEENRALHVANSRLAWDNEELQRKVAATSDLLTEAQAANQKLQDQLATALQDGMDLVQQLAEARRVPRKVSSDTPPAKPAFGLLGYATKTMRSPWEADLQWGKSTPAPPSSLSKAYRWGNTMAELGEHDQYAADATSPIMALTWTPSKFSSPTSSGAFTSTAAHGVMSETEAMPGSLSNLSSSPLSPLHLGPFPSTAQGLSLLAQAQYESAQLATTPLSQLLVGRHVTDTRSFMSTPFPAGVQAMLAGMPSVTPTSGPLSPLIRSSQANHQALCWGNTLVDFGGPACVVGHATPLPSMQTPTPIDFEAMLMDVPSSRPTPVRVPGLTLTLTPQANNQALTLVNCKADFGGQHYFAGDATSSPLPSKLDGDSSWSPSMFLAPTPVEAETTHNALSGMEAVPLLSASELSLTLAAPTTQAPTTQAPISSTTGESPSVTQAQGEGAQPAVSSRSKCFPTISVMGTPPTAGAEAMLMGVPHTPPSPRSCGATLRVKAKKQVEVSATASAGRTRTPLGDVTNVLGSQVTSGRTSSTPTRFTPMDGLRSGLKAAVPSPLKPAESQPSPPPTLCQLQTQTLRSKDSLSNSPGTPPNVDLASPAPALLRCSPAVVAVQPGFRDMLVSPMPTPTLVRATPKLAASASHVAQTQVALQAAGLTPVVVTPPSRPHAELPSTNSNTSSSRGCSRTSPQTSPATCKASQSPTSCLSRPWSIAGPNSPAVSSTSLAPAVNSSTVAAARSTQAQRSSTSTGMITRARASGPAGVTPSRTHAVRTAIQPATAASTGVTTRARASGQAGVTSSTTKAVRPASQVVTAASTARTGSTGRAVLSTIAEADTRAGQRAKQAAGQAGTSHSAGSNAGSNRRCGRSQAGKPAAAPIAKQAAAPNVKQAAAPIAKQAAAPNAKQAAAHIAKQAAASVASAAANRASPGAKAAGTRAAGKTNALKAEVPTRVQPPRVARKGWR
ncbi:hypothetical protein ABBQ38_000148 [Trebouxia sp. C0009 RCD-2024]